MSSKLKMKDRTTKYMIIRGLPIMLHNRFKSKCAVQGKSMNAKVIQLIKEFVDKD